MTGFKSALLLSATLTLAACGGQQFDFDLRDLGNGFDTSNAVQNATVARPNADARGVITYPNYQVALARQGDTVADVAGRIGLNEAELARHNGLSADTRLRAGEVLVLPRRVEGGAPGISSTSLDGASDLAAIAGNAIDRASPATPGRAATAQAADGVEPIRHKVARGETAFTIARLYDVPVRALADWNGLAADLAVREGQFLIIPVVIEEADVDEPEDLTPPPSSATPLPKPEATPAPTPATPTPKVEMASEDDDAAMRMPVSGSIIREYQKGKNDGIDIAAAAGATVVAAQDGTVAAVTRDTDQVPILVLRHADNLLTVYAGVDGLTVKKGDSVSKGQKIAVVRNATPSFLHFEVRRGLDSVNPMDFLN